MRLFVSSFWGYMKHDERTVANWSSVVAIGDDFYEDWTEGRQRHRKWFGNWNWLLMGRSRQEGNFEDCLQWLCYWRSTHSKISCTEKLVWPILHSGLQKLNWKIISKGYRGYGSWQNTSWGHIGIYQYLVYHGGCEINMFRTSDSCENEIKNSLINLKARTLQAAQHQACCPASSKQGHAVTLGWWTGISLTWTDESLGFRAESPRSQ